MPADCAKLSPGRLNDRRSFTNGAGGPEVQSDFPGEGHFAGVHLTYFPEMFGCAEKGPALRVAASTIGQAAENSRPKGEKGLLLRQL